MTSNRPIRRDSKRYKAETRTFIHQDDVLRLRIEDHFTGGYELWDGDASIIMDKDKVEIRD